MAVGRAAIDKAIANRAEEFRAQKNTISLKAILRLLEKDLGLEAKGLKAEKGYIDEAVLKIINEPTPKKKSREKPAVPAKKRRKQGAREVVDDSESGEDHEEDEGPSEQSDEAGETDTEETKQKTTLNPSSKTGSKEKQASKRKREESEDERNDVSDDEDREEEEDDDEEDEAARRKRKEPKRLAQQKPLSSKRVERLKETIKECGLKIPPNVYMKARQAGEGRQEDVLVRGLQALLEKEGLSANPSKDEIKAVRRRIEKRKDLEGIDVGNVIEEPRAKRRTTTFVPPKYKVEDSENDSEDDEEEENEEDEGSDEEFEDDNDDD